MNDKKVIIVIPLYTTRLTEQEHASLRRCFDVLKDYPKCFVKPRSLDIASLEALYGEMAAVSFDDDYFKGIAGYNRLMLSPDFYRSFPDWEYMLIYQTDAWVFFDGLRAWCDRGYDYIGAPWIPKPKYERLYYRIFTHLKHLYCALTGASDYSHIYYRVGNGGLSLRRIGRFAEIAEEMHDTIAAYLAHPEKNLYNEDLFWSIEVNRSGEKLNIPAWREALDFSFDKNPGRCYELNDRRLPFGCHGWSKKNMLPFWVQHIPAANIEP